MSKYEGLTRNELSSLVDDRAYDLTSYAEDVVNAINIASYNEIYKRIKQMREQADLLEEAVEALEDKEQQMEGEEYERNQQA